MKKKILFGSLIVLIVVAISALIGFAMEKYNATKNPLDAFPYETIHCSYESGDKTYQTGFTFNKGMVLVDANDLSEDLTKASVALASSAYDKDYMYNVLSSMGFSADNIHQYYDREATLYRNDFVAYNIAIQDIEYDGDTYKLYCVPVRGTPGSAEWYSNFNLGTSGNHEGFYTAATEVLSSISTFVQNDGVDADHRIFWITGHSRGAAVANIVAGYLTDKSIFSTSEHIFGYTFACPSVSKEANTSYTNIYNFNNPGDLIPELPLEEWGYKRYGETLSLDVAGIDNLENRFLDETGETYKAVTTTQDYMEIINRLVVNEEVYHTSEGKLFFLLAGYALGGNENTTIEDLIGYAGYTSGDVFIEMLVKVVLAKYGYLEMYEAAEKLISDIEILKAFANSGLNETVNMTDEEFVQWVAENRDKIDEIESATNYNIETRADLVVAASALTGDTSDIVKITEVFYYAAQLWGDTDGSLMAAIEHGHTQGTYVLWINSMYYGYKGWYGNSELTNITLPAFMNNIANSCFAHCSKLENIEIPESVRYIATSSFYSCESLKEIVIPNDIVKIDSNSIVNCTSLNKITIPVDFNYVGTSFISGCSNLTYIYYTYGKTGIMPDRQRSDSDESNYYENTLEYGARATLTTIEFDEGITRIGNNAYYAYYNGNDAGKLTSVKFPAALESIGNYAFAYQNALGEVTIPEGVKTLDDYCFYESSGITGLSLPESLETIGNSCFSGCNKLAGKLYIPEKLTNIGDFAFSYCTSLEETEIISSDTVLGNNAFNSCKGMKKVTLPVDIEYTKAEVFNNCGAESIYYTYGKTGVLPDRQRSDSDESNYYENTLEYGARATLTTIEFDEGITRIGNNAYYDNTTIKDVLFSSTVEEIGFNNFSNINTSIATFYGIKDTLPESYAEEKGVDFIPLNYPLIVCDTDFFEKNKQYQFTAKVYTGIDVFNTDVVWSVEGASSVNTSIDENGLLFIASDEKADGIIVVASYGENAASFQIIVDHPIYSVEFIGDLETVMEADENGLVDCPKNLEAEGYKYTYYLIQGDAEKLISDGEWPLCITDDASIRVHKEEIIYTITYYLDGGENHSDNPIKYSISNNSLALQNPVKNEYDFVGWYTDPEYKNVFTSLSEYSGDLNLYALWEVAMAPIPTIEPTETPMPTATATVEPTISPTVTPTVMPSIEPTATSTPTVEPTKAPISIEDYIDRVILSESTFIYDGKEKEPVVEINGLVLGTDYEVAYDNNLNIGTANVTITGIGNYTGIINVTFVIICNHVEVIDKAVESTCTETGLTEGKHCSVCNEVLVEQKFIEAYGHSYLNGVCDNCDTLAYQYEITSDGIMIVDCDESVTSLSIPSTIEGYTVVAIGESAFASCTSLISLSLPNSVVTIGSDAFSGCKNLVLSCYSGSYIEEYAAENGLLFQKAVCEMHTEVIDPAIEPTETETGLTEGKHCSVCGEVLVPQEVIPVKKVEIYYYGDISGDGTVNASDALAILKHAAKLEAIEGELLSTLADINGDGNINASDALEALKVAAKLSDVKEYHHISSEEGQEVALFNVDYLAEAIKSFDFI